MQLQDSLLRDLPVLKDPVLQSLDRINVDRHLLDQEVKHEMRKGAARHRAQRSVLTTMVVIHSKISRFCTKTHLQGCRAWCRGRALYRYTLSCSQF